jgi:nucleoside permease NupC
MIRLWVWAGCRIFVLSNRIFAWCRPERRSFEVSQLIGIKVVDNEFVAVSFPSPCNLKSRLFISLSLGLWPAMRRILHSLLAPVILPLTQSVTCSISSVGIQIGVLPQLPWSGHIAKVALISGVIATLMSASIAWMLIVDETAYI